MSDLYSVIVLFLFIFFSMYILIGNPYRMRIFCIDKYNDVYYSMGKLMLYTLFIIITGPVFLTQPFSMIKYAVYLFTLILLLIFSKTEMPRNIIITIYWVFWAWLCLSTFRSPYISDAILLLIKYLIPIFSLYLGYIALNNKYDLLCAYKVIVLVAVIYTFLFGGISEKLFNWLYISDFCAIFLKYAGFADYLTSIFVIPFVLAWWSKDSKWYIAAGLLFLSTLLQIVRTGLGGMFIVAVIFYFFRYKLKSLPIIFGLVMSMLVVLVYVPSVSQKFFEKKAGTIMITDVIEKNALALDNIQTHSRNHMWQLAEDYCYKGHEIAGTGLGNSTRFLKIMHKAQPYVIPELMHNDYMQLKCDTGLIGLGLFAAFLIISFIYVGMNIWGTNNELLKFTGITALASLAGTAFSMGFDNVVSHSMSSLIMPFIFLGMFFKAKDLTVNESIS